VARRASARVCRPPADFFTGLIDAELAALGADRTTLATIRGVPDIP
jgi:hypothetical protein